MHKITLNQTRILLFNNIIFVQQYILYSSVEHGRPNVKSFKVFWIVIDGKYQYSILFFIIVYTHKKNVYRQLPCIRQVNLELSLDLQEVFLH